MAALFDKGNLLTGTQPVDSALSSTSEFPLQNKVIKQNFDSITTTLGGKVNTSDIKNNLTSTDTDKPLSAYQGKVLDDKITTVSSNLTNYQTDNGWYVKKYSSGYFEAYKHDEVNSSGTSSATFFNAYSHAKVVSLPSFITNPTSQIKVLNSNVRVGNGFAIQVYQSVASDGMHISALANLQSGYYASDHYMFGTL